MLTGFLIFAYNPIAVLAHDRHTMQYRGLSRTDYRPQPAEIEFVRQLNVNIFHRRLFSVLRSLSFVLRRLSSVFRPQPTAPLPSRLRPRGYHGQAVFWHLICGLSFDIRHWALDVGRLLRNTSSALSPRSTAYSPSFVRVHCTSNTLRYTSSLLLSGHSGPPNPTALDCISTKALGSTQT